jgi:hypothetical protein
MMKKPPNGLRQAMEDDAFGGRSKAYRWLRKNFDELSRGLAEFRPSWDAVAAQMAREGIIGQRGKPPYGHAVRRVWERVCRDVAKDRAAQAATPPKPRSPYPARNSAMWRPPPLNAPSGQGAPSAHAGASMSPGAAGSQPRTAQEKVAALRQTLKPR